MASANYPWPNTVRVIILRGVQWMRHIGHIAAVRNADKILVRKPKGRDLLERYGCRWENNIPVHLKEM